MSLFRIAALLLARTATAAELRFTIAAPPLAASIPSDFVGFSLEVPSAPQMLNSAGPGSAPRASYAALMRFLASVSPTLRGPNIRVGGSSADASTFGAPSDPLPANVMYMATEADLAGYAAAAAAWRGSITVDVNLGRAVPGGFLSRSAAHAAAAVRVLGPLLDGIEIVRVCVCVCVCGGGGGGRGSRMRAGPLSFSLSRPALLPVHTRPRHLCRATSRMALARGAGTCGRPPTPRGTFMRTLPLPWAHSGRRA